MKRSQTAMVNPELTGSKVFRRAPTGNAVTAQLAGAALAVLQTFSPLPAVAQTQDPVQMVDKGTHYEVTLDFDSGATHREIGEAYGRKIKELAPQFEEQLDSYFADFAPSWIVRKVLYRRVRQIKPQLSQDYKDEIEGIASQLSGGDNNTCGDGKVSVDELYAFNLLGDIARLTQCCALAVFGDRSANGTTIVGRNFDWPDGKENQLSQIQAVITFKNGPKSITNIACLGFQGAVTAFNNRSVFSAVLDAPTGTKFSASKKRSFVLDLRQALEESSSLEEISKFMDDSEHKYSFCHSILLADAKTAAVLENNISSSCPQHLRDLRYCDSKLRGNAEWGVSDAVGCVNCFELEGNVDNHIDPFDKKAKRKPGTEPADINTPRWNSIKEQIVAQGPKVSFDGMKNILSFFHPESGGNIRKGDLYNSLTMQSVVFEPATFSLHVAFRPKDGKLPHAPQFEHISSSAK